MLGREREREKWGSLCVCVKGMSSWCVRERALPKEKQMLGREREGEREREVCVSRYLSVLWFPLSFSLFVLLSLSLSLSFSLSCFKTGFSVRRWCLIWQRSSTFQLDESFGFLPHTKYQNKTKQKNCWVLFSPFLAFWSNWIKPIKTSAPSTEDPISFDYIIHRR